MSTLEVHDVVARNIRILAERRGLALNALADFAGVSRSQLFNVLSGNSSPSLEWVAKVAQAFGIEPWQLISPSASAIRRRRKTKSN